MPLYTGEKPAGFSGSRTTSKTEPSPVVAAAYSATTASATYASLFPARSAVCASRSDGSSVTRTGLDPQSIARSRSPCTVAFCTDTVLPQRSDCVTMPPGLPASTRIAKPPYV